MKILMLSDIDPKGSGYYYITTNLAKELVNRNHDVKVLGWSYDGSEHNFPFSIIPCSMGFRETIYTFHNMRYVWNPDVFVCGMDIPQQRQLIQKIAQEYKTPYVAVCPLENDPLTISWGMSMMFANQVLVISEFGAHEFAKVGIANSSYLPVGIDTASWRLPLPEERKKARESFGIEPDEFVILTVADNQERKNLTGAMNIVAKAKQKIGKVRYVMVTREHNFYGYALRDYAQEVGIAGELTIFERGLEFKELWLMYAIADAFLLPSKAEGFGMPIIEAMACGVPVVATACCAIPEKLADGRGYLIPYVYKFRDAFGNAWRYLIDEDAAASALETIWIDPDGHQAMIERARKYVESLTWEKSGLKLEEAVKKAYEQKEQAAQQPQPVYQLE